MFYFILGGNTIFIISESVDLCFGEGNGTPLQYSCLENPMDGGAWLAAVHGVAKSRTRLSDFTHFDFCLYKDSPWYLAVVVVFS